MQNPGLHASLAEPAPAGDGGVVAHHQVVIARQTDRVHVRRQGDRPIQLHQRQVVLEGVEVVLGVDDLLQGAPLLVRVGFVQRAEVVLADTDADLRQ